MGYILFIQKEAVLELKEAFEWYEEQKEGLGYELIEEIETCYNDLSINPERYPYINQSYRRIKTKRFTYLLIYEIEDSHVYSKQHTAYKAKSLIISKFAAQ